MHQFLPYAWFEGRCIPFDQAKVSIATHALHYGTGAFGGMRAIPDPEKPGGMLLFPPARHARRLSQSAKLLLADLTEETVMEALVAVLRANKPTTPIYLRPFVYTSDLGIAPRLHNIETDFLIYGLELGDYLSPDGVSCRISSWTRQEDRSLPPARKNKWCLHHKLTSQNGSSHKRLLRSPAHEHAGKSQRSQWHESIFGARWSPDHPWS